MARIACTPALSPRVHAARCVVQERGCEVHPTPLRQLTGAGGFSMSALFALPPPELARVTMGEVDFDFSWER